MTEARLPAPAHYLIRLYLLIAVVGAVFSAPLLAFIGWMAWSFTRDAWPGNWIGWLFFALFSVILICGPFVGRRLYKRGRHLTGLGVSLFSFLVAPMIVAGMVIS